MCARPRQPVVQRFEIPLEACRETLGDAALLLRPLLGVTVQPHLAAVGIVHLLEVHRAARAGAMGRGRLGVEPAPALAADHDVAVSVLGKPRDLLPRGDAPVEHHARPRPPQSLLRQVVMPNESAMRYSRPISVDGSRKVSFQPVWIRPGGGMSVIFS